MKKAKNETRSIKDIQRNKKNQETGSEREVGLPEDVRVVYSEESNPHDG